MASMSKAGVADASAAGATSLDALSSAMASEPAEAGAADAGETAAPTAGSESWQPPSRTTRNSRGAMRTGNFIETPCSGEVAQADLCLPAGVVPARGRITQNGRASGGERWGRYVYISVCPGSYKKNK